MPRFDVTSIGEGQLRLCVPAGKRLEQVTQFDVFVSGTEANVVGLLSRLGWRSGFITSLPDGPLGRRVLNEYRMAGIDLGGCCGSPPAGSPPITWNTLSRPGPPRCSTTGRTPASPT